MATVAVVGAGELGGAIAHALSRRESVPRIVLLDANTGIAAGKALDIQQAGAIEASHTRLEGTDDTSRVIGCDVLVIADRGGRTDEWQGEEGLAHLRELLRFAGGAPVILAGVRQTDLLLAAVLESGVARHRIVGSSPEALVSALRAIVALEARCSAAEVSLTVLGGPLDFIVSWSEATIAGCALERVLSPVQQNAIQARAARLWPPGPQGLAVAAARVVEGVLRHSLRTHSVLAVLEGEFGVRHRVGVLPVLLSPSGISEIRVPQLNTRERVLVETALGA